MKLKTLASIALLSIPMYLFTINTAKADEFKINLEDSTVKIEGEKKKKPNVFDERLTTQAIEEFRGRVYDRMDRKIKERIWTFSISKELEDFIYRPEWTTLGMNDNELRDYMDKVNEEAKDIMERELRKQAQEEFKESEFYKELKEKIRYYERKITDTFRERVEEKEAYINEEGGINFEYRKLKYERTDDPPYGVESTNQTDAQLVIEETQIEKQDKKKSKFQLKRKKIGLVLERDSFILRIKTRPFHIHSWDYEPQAKIYLITKYGTAILNTEYSLKDNEIDTGISTVLPKGFTFYLSHEYDADKGNDVLYTVLQKNIKGWTVSGSYSAETKNIEDGTFWLRFEKRF